MDQAKFEEAQTAYRNGDFRAAAKRFLAAAGGGAAGNGAAYHMAGNSLMRLRRYQDALTVYGQALRDETYGRSGAVHANRGRAYAALGDYAAACDAFRSALAEADYTTHYKAYQGLASALFERGRIDEAASAYYKAAVDPANPAPGKALVNLGLCLMALDRPGDAVQAYQAALGLDGYAGHGKALANLGVAYARLGRHEEAVHAFEKATQLHGHKLSEPARKAYEMSRAMIAPAPEVVEGWETADIAAASLVGTATGWGTGELAALGAPATPSADEVVDRLGFGDEAAVSEYFKMTEEEMRARDREAKRAARAAKRANGGWARSALSASAFALLVVGSLALGWYFGLGWPTQSATTNGMLSAYQTGADCAPYWVAVPDKDIAKELAKIPPVKSFTVDSVDRGARKSTVSVTVTPKEGSPLHYKVTLVREGVGWKVTGVDNEWSSTRGASGR